MEVLEIDEAVRHWKAKGLDLTPILTPAAGPHPDTVTHCTISQNHGLEEVLDNELIKKALAAIHEQTPVRFLWKLRILTGHSVRCSATKFPRPTVRTVCLMTPFISM